MTPPESDCANGQKSKKRRNELQREGTITGVDRKGNNIPKDDKFEEGLLHADRMTKDLTAANEEYQEQQSTKNGNTKNGLPAAHVECEEQQIDNNVSITELLANDSQLEKKTKKKTEGKMKKTQGERDLDIGVTMMTDNQETMPMKREDQSTNALPIQKKTFSNGLIIEELASGAADGKVACPGKKVKNFYTGMLNESGLVFYSNIGKTAFKFQLGDEEFIDGWNVGINGMRVGDKRRLMIPPSMGFGDHGVGENAPPN